MGIVHKPEIDLYWIQSKILETKGIRDLMSRDRFRHIRSSLSFYDPTSDYSNEPTTYYKIKKLVNNIVQNSRKYYIPERHLSVDEGMIKFTGRHNFKQYMPNKPTKYGFKVYMLSESVSWYIYSYELYQASQKSLEKQKNEVGAIAKLFRRLTSNITGKGYIIYADKFFSNMRAIECLKSLEFYFCGSI
jgi:hypothetical protein